MKAKHKAIKLKNITTYTQMNILFDNKNQKQDRKKKQGDKPPSKTKTLKIEKGRRKHYAHFREKTFCAAYCKSLIA